MSRERCGAVAARVAATLLQLASRQRCYNSCRCGTVVAGVAATLRRCCCDAIVARNNDRKQCTMQRWQAALVFAVTTSRATLLCSDGKWPAPNFFVFFFTRQFQRENKIKTERKETGLRNLFPGFIGWQAPSCQLPPSTSTPFSGSSNTSIFRQQQHISTFR